eukprot:6160292-Amphidinium_carterae.1
MQQTKCCKRLLVGKVIRPRVLCRGLATVMIVHVVLHHVFFLKTACRLCISWTCCQAGWALIQWFVAEDPQSFE